KLRPCHRLVRPERPVRVAAEQPLLLCPCDGAGGPMIARHIAERPGRHVVLAKAVLVDAPNDPRRVLRGGGPAALLERPGLQFGRSGLTHVTVAAEGGQDAGPIFGTLSTVVVATKPGRHLDALAVNGLP